MNWCSLPLIDGSSYTLGPQNCLILLSHLKFLGLRFGPTWTKQ